MSGSNTKRRVTYFYDSEIGNFYYGQGHPMKPHRVRMAHSLVLRYGLYDHLQVYKPFLATQDDLATFHDEDYLEFLRHVNPENQDQHKDALRRFNTGNDCPLFDGLYRYCQIYAGGSIGCAVQLNYGHADVAINWAGGLHHAKKAEASGFCYINDIVLAILELLKYHARVLYIDIDIHHGDGVEEAFLTTDRVMTVSFHKYGSKFFPGTGALEDTGLGLGKYYSVNVPLCDGMDDESYRFVFEPIMARVMTAYRPEVVVLQSGADTLAGDRLGAFNLSISGHAACHRFMQSFGVPLLVLGGGGYKIKNVARCWAYETGVLMGADMDDALPPCEYYECFSPSYSLSIPTQTTMPNGNTRAYLEKVCSRVLSNLARISPPGVAFSERPPDAVDPDRLKQVGGGGKEAQHQHGNDGRFSDAEDEEDVIEEDMPLSSLRFSAAAVTAGAAATPRLLCQHAGDKVDPIVL